MVNNSKQSGFTLIELLVVISIVGILSVVVLAGLQEVRNTAHDSTVKSHVVQMANLIEISRSNKGNYSDVRAGAFGLSTLSGTTLFSTNSSQRCDTKTFFNTDMRDLCLKIEQVFDGSANWRLYWTITGPWGSWHIDWVIPNTPYYMFINTNGPSHSEYAIFANLRSGNSDWFCIDSTGTRKTVTNPRSNATRCP